MRFSKHYLAAISAFILWGFFSFGLKPLHNYPSLDILFYRVFLCVILMLCINLLFRRAVVRESVHIFIKMLPVERKRFMALTAGSALLLTANWFFFIFVMNHISVKAASLAYLVCPIITTVFAYFILKEVLTKIQWTAVVLSVISCVLLSLNHFIDIFYSLIIAATYAMYLIIQKKIVAIDRFLLLTIQLIITAVILLPFYPVFSSTVPIAASFYWHILIIAVAFTIIPLFLNLYALKQINSSTVGILLYINPLITFLLAIFYYKESITSLQVAAYSLILVSIVIFNAGNFFKAIKAKSK